MTENGSTIPPFPSVPTTPPAAPTAGAPVPPPPPAAPTVGAPVPPPPAPSGAAPAAPAPYGAPPQPYGAPPVPPAPYGAAPQPYSAADAPVGEKSFIATWLLAWLVGFWGVDRFYLGKVGTGLAKLFTFGGLGVWVLIDLILVLTGSQRDSRGFKLAGYDQYKKIAWIVTGSVVALGIIINIISGAAAGARVASELPDTPAVVVESGTTDEAPATDSDAAAPAPEATVQAWADETFGTFAPAQQSGTGDSIITLPGTAGIVTATHNGSANFALSVLDATNTSTGELLVNTIGAYSGTTVYGFNSFSEPATLQVMADGDWTITISPVSTAPLLAPSGTGDAVFLYDGGAAALTATHSGSANFVILEESGEAFSMGLLVNEIGAYSGTVPLSAGPSAISVQADGAWTLAVN
ncbi:TM2 domain-containing protein [Agromyces sp. CF514]|uniref:TM2 domain-containing protein n=1 Tax=Agromyces sp. CF514 TaxID=1881031 RepID=UPI0008E3DC2D|nr:TM2 domain-containing protein [Agromyces sp. CF514]SFR83534.1 TM2 domain-containing protein [Agromyces sp. CF514]